MDKHLWITKSEKLLVLSRTYPLKFQDITVRHNWRPLKDGKVYENHVCLSYFLLLAETKYLSPKVRGKKFYFLQVGVFS